MSRWYRAYAGMMRDDKLVRVALKSRQSIERVCWIWCAILESAAEIDDGGRYDIDADEFAYFLRADLCDVQSVLAGLEAMGRVGGGGVVKWGDRQFQSDRSAERQKRYRDKQKAVMDRNTDRQVTPALRHGDAPETETELDTTTEPNGPVVVRAKRKTKIDPVWQPSESGLSSALKRGLTEPEIQRETSRFINHHTAKGNLMASWDAAWVTWIDSPFRQANRANGPPAGRESNNARALRALEEMIPDGPVQSEPRLRLA